MACNADEVLQPGVECFRQRRIVVAQVLVLIDAHLGHVKAMAAVPAGRVVGLVPAVEDVDHVATKSSGFARLPLPGGESPSKASQGTGVVVDKVLQVATCPNGRKHTEDLREGFFASHRHDERHTAAGQQSCERVPIVAGEAGLNALDEAAGVGNLSE